MEKRLSTSAERIAQGKPKGKALRQRPGEDLSLDDFLDMTDQLFSSEKRLIKKLLQLRQNQNTRTVTFTIAGLSRLLQVDTKTVRSGIRRLISLGFLIDKGEVMEKGFNFKKKKCDFPDKFPGFEGREELLADEDWSLEREKKKEAEEFQRYCAAMMRESRKFTKLERQKQIEEENFEPCPDTVVDEDVKRLMDSIKAHEASLPKLFEFADLTKLP